MKPAVKQLIIKYGLQEAEHKIRIKDAKAFYNAICLVYFTIKR